MNFSERLQEIRDGFERHGLCRRQSHPQYFHRVRRFGQRVDRAPRGRRAHQVLNRIDFLLQAKRAPGVGDGGRQDEKRLAHLFLADRIPVGDLEGPLALLLDLEGVLQAVRERDRTPGALDYGLQGPRGEVLAGRLATASAPAGWSTLDLGEGPETGQDLDRLRVLVVPMGERKLLVGEELERVSTLDALILRAPNAPALPEGSEVTVIRLDSLGI